MSHHLLVTGGTGVLGRHVVGRLVDGGHDIRVLSRRPAPVPPGIRHVLADLSKDADLGPALDGVEIVLHLAGSARGDGRKTERLVRAARTARVRHLVLISVVGADRVPVRSLRDRMAFGYYAEKRAAEFAVEGLGLPFTVLRATQFHDLLLRTFAGMRRSPVAVAFRGVRFQPVEAAEVADRLVELALEAPQGLVDPVAGPHVVPMADLLRSYLQATDAPKRILLLGTGGAAAAAIRAGANLDPAHAVGRLTWEEFLAARVGPAAR